MLAIAGVALPLIAAILAARRLDASRAGWLTSMPIVIGVAFGISSIVFFALMLLPIGSRGGLLAADAAVWIAIDVVLFVSRRRARSTATAPVPTSGGSPRWFAAVAAVLLVCNGAIAVVRFVATTATTPHGAWDAWAFWNAHARALFLGYPNEWRQATSAILHGDYPLLTPAAIARVWQYVGHDAIAVPIALAAIVTSAIVLLAAGAVGRERGAAQGMLAAAAILGAPAFTAAAPSQFADIPIAFYILATVVAFDRATTSEGTGWWIVAGGAAGCAAWTKNEGQAFLLFVGIAAAIWTWRRRADRGARPIVAFGAGALPAIVALALFRWALPFPHEVLNGLTADRVRARLHTLARWRAIGTAIGQQLWFGGATVVGVLPIVAACTVLTGFARPVRSSVRYMTVVIGAMLLADALVYLFSPYDLAWHLSTSVDRVVVQLLPSLIWLILLYGRRLNPVESPRSTAATPSEKEKR